MTSVERVVSTIRGEIARLETNDLNGVIFKDREWYNLLDGVPPLDAILHPQPDVLCERLHPDERVVLGTYTPIRSPGVITLYIHNIRNFFWRIIEELTNQPLRAFITKGDLERIALLTTTKTLHHEVFHFNCDVFRLLFSAAYDVEGEESLAVAYSRLRIESEQRNANTQLGRINAVLYSSVMDIAYRYTSPGYRDWYQFADHVRFKDGLVRYIKPGQYQRLQANGIAAHELLFDQLGKLTGYIEQTK